VSSDTHLDFEPSLTAIFPDQWTRPFWDAAHEHRLVACRCADCHTFRMPPTAMCWRCRSRAVEWVDLPGTGSVYTFTVARHALTPAAQAAVPYVIAVVALDGAGGARLITNLVGVEPADVTIDMPVTVVFDDVSDTVSVPRFRPVDPASGQTGPSPQVNTGKPG
jgi:uncharacterized OB-fold protein